MSRRFFNDDSSCQSVQGSEACGTESAVGWFFVVPK